MAAGIPELDGRQRRCGLHSARKSLATWLYNLGVSDAVIARIIRHETTMTQARYIDPDPGMELEAIRRLPAIFPAVGSFPETQVPQSQGLSTFSQGLIPDRLQNESAFTILSPSDGLLHDNRKPAPVPQEVRRCPSHPSGVDSVSGLSTVEEKPGLNASAAVRETPSGDSRDRVQTTFTSDSGQFLPASESDLNLYAQAVERLGRLLEARYGVGDRNPGI